jgi:hypothetical protein
MSIDHDIFGEYAVYPGHPITCAVIVLHAYKDRLADAWKAVPPSGYHHCECHLDTPLAGGHLAKGCNLIRYVLSGEASIDDVIAWGDRMWIGAGGHKQNEAPGQDQADRLKPKLREMLAAIMPAAETT